MLKKMIKTFRNVSVVRRRVFSHNKQYLNIMKNCSQYIDLKNYFVLKLLFIVE